MRSLNLLAEQFASVKHPSTTAPISAMGRRRRPTADLPIKSPHAPPAQTAPSGHRTLPGFAAQFRQETWMVPPRTQAPPPESLLRPSNTAGLGRRAGDAA